MSGSKGAQQGGRFVIEDPRQVFSLPQDRQVIVYFEWDGPPGAHHFEGRWKNPEGKVVVVSDFKYEARERRFGGYWTLVLTETTQPGLWALEAYVDGEMTGMHAVQLVAGPAPTPTTPTRPLLSPSEVYQRAGAASVFIEKLGRDGERLVVGSGFSLKEGLLVTAFQVIDGAATLRILFPDGSREETQEVLAWNRRQDWAVLKLAEHPKRPELPRAQSDSWSVGDRCFHLDSPAEESRTIADATIIGVHTFPGAGPRLNVSYLATGRATGSPVLNEYGEVIGIVGGGLIPGAGSLNMPRLTYSSALAGIGFPMRGDLAVPISLIPVSPPPSTTPLQELARTGQFTPPLVGHRNILHGSLARGLQTQGGISRPWDEKPEFSRRDNEIVVFITWEPKEKRKAQTHLRLYDLDNRALIQSKPTKLNLKTGEIFNSAWKLTIGRLLPGIYRIDIFIDSDPAWRTFFRITE